MPLAWDVPLSMPGCAVLCCVMLQGVYNRLNDQSCKRVLHAVCHNRSLKKVSSDDPGWLLCHMRHMITCSTKRPAVSQVWTPCKHQSAGAKEG